MKKQYDVIVLGAGSMGMAAGYNLSKLGIKTLMIDSYNPPHEMGSHHGDTRMIRHAYAEGKQYVPLVLRAQQLWNELEAEINQKLFYQTGVLSVGEIGSSFIKSIISSANEFKLPLDTLSASEIAKQWPGIKLDDSLTGCFESESGVLLSEECVKAFKKLAQYHGAELLTDVKMNSMDSGQSGVTIVTDEGTFYADYLVISTGASAVKTFASLGLNLSLQPIRKTVAWFNSDPHLYNWRRFPAFDFSLQSGTYYGFPDFDEQCVKLGRHDGGQQVDAEEVNRDFAAFPEEERDLKCFLNTYLPAAAGQLRKGKVCLYSMTPDENFIIDRTPQYPHVIAVAGFSGHGFKFSSVVGEIVSQMIVNGHSSLDISLFAIDRQAINISNKRRSQ